MRVRHAATHRLGVDVPRRAQQHGAKTAFFFWGCEHHGHHRPDFEIQDTVNMPRALAVLTDIVTEINGQH